MDDADFANKVVYERPRQKKQDDFGRFEDAQQREFLESMRLNKARVIAQLNRNLLPNHRAVLLNGLNFINSELSKLKG